MSWHTAVRPSSKSIERHPQSRDNSLFSYGNDSKNMTLESDDHVELRAGRAGAARRAPRAGLALRAPRAGRALRAGLAGPPDAVEVKNARLPDWSNIQPS